MNIYQKIFLTNLLLVLIFILKTFSLPEKCLLPKSSGTTGKTCTSKLSKYYFNPKQYKCQKFVYTGCGGNDNRFDSREECEKLCNLTEEEKGKQEELNKTANTPVETRLLKSSASRRIDTSPITTVKPTTIQPTTIKSASNETSTNSTGNVDARNIRRYRRPSSKGRRQMGGKSGRGPSGRNRGKSGRNRGKGRRNSRKMKGKSGRRKQMHRGKSMRRNKHSDEESKDSDENKERQENENDATKKIDEDKGKGDKNVGDGKERGSEETMVGNKTVSDGVTTAPGKT